MEAEDYDRGFDPVHAGGVMRFDSFPFHIGPTIDPRNPDGLPNTWPFTFGFDSTRGALVQYATPELLQVLDRAYRVGQLFGTPLDDRSGKPYSEDFLAFIDESATPGGQRALEIGAGVGYITRRLVDNGWRATGIEPGKGYTEYWERYDVEIINEYFPNARTPGPFDLICSCGVLEHIADPEVFLINIRERLAPGGAAIFSVPDCTEEIEAGDPSILVHEHFTYFNAETLSAMLRRTGFSAVVRKSGYGRCLHAAAHNREAVGDPVQRDDLAHLMSYPHRTGSYIAMVRERLSELLGNGSVGIYCPARALGILDPGMELRFFDDDMTQQNKFLPPFTPPIESRASLLADPVETVIVMSRTFGEQIRNSLKNSGYTGRIIVLSDYEAP